MTQPPSEAPAGPPTDSGNTPPGPPPGSPVGPPQQPPMGPAYGSAPYQPPPSPSAGASTVLKRVLRIALSVGVVFAIGAGVRAFQDSRDDAERDEDGSITSEQDVSVFEIKEGDCLDDAALSAVGTEVDSSVEDVHAIPCDKPHSYEAYHVFALEAGDYPGPVETPKLAEAGCIKAFQPFIGIPPQRSSLEFMYLYPQQGAWTELDDRSVVCLVGEPGGATSTGSLKGAKR